MNINNFRACVTLTRKMSAATGWIARLTRRMAALQALEMEPPFPHACALPCTTPNAHSSPSNCGI